MAFTLFDKKDNNEQCPCRSFDIDNRLYISRLSPGTKSFDPSDGLFGQGVAIVESYDTHVDFLIPATPLPPPTPLPQLQPLGNGVGGFPEG